MDWFDFSLKLPITDPTWIFLLVLLIILFAPILLNKLRIPHIIGMILAGLVIGEHGFNILVRDSSFELFGKVGLYYIMFLAGLEMNMGDFKQNRGKALVLGLLAFIVPIGIGLVTNIALLKYGVLTSVLLASMYASHTLVAYPIVIRYGVSRHRSVSIAVGGTAVTDTLTLLVLAVVGGMFKGESDGFFWVWLVIKVIFLGILIVYLFPRIGRWFFRRYDDNVMQFIFVLAMVFLGAGLMEFVGMEGILGAFLAGLVLNRLIPHVSPLMNHLEFVGNALFIPYFLIGVGMLIDVHVIFGHGDALKVAAVMIVVALAGKWIACWLTQKIYKMGGIERELMYGLSNAQAAATLAAVLVGYNIILPNGERRYNTLYHFKIEQNQLVNGKYRSKGRHETVNPISESLQKRFIDNGMPQEVLTQLVGKKPAPSKSKSGSSSAKAAQAKSAPKTKTTPSKPPAKPKTSMEGGESV